MAVTVKSKRAAVVIGWSTSGDGGGEVEPPGGFPEFPVDPNYGIEEGGPPTATHPIYLPPYIDNSLPQPQPHPDHTLPTPEQPVDPDYGIEEGGKPKPPGAFPGDPGYQPPTGSGAPPSVATPVHAEGEVLAVQIFAQGQEGDWSNTSVMKNDGEAALHYPEGFTGESYVEVRALDGTLVDSGTITVK